MNEERSANYEPNQDLQAALHHEQDLSDRDACRPLVEVSVTDTDEDWARRLTLIDPSCLPTPPNVSPYAKYLHRPHSDQESAISLHRL